MLVSRLFKHASYIRTAVPLALVALVGALGLHASAAAPEEPKLDADALMVAFKPQAPQAARLQSINRLGLENATRRQNRSWARVRLSPQARANGLSLRATMNALRRDPNVRLVEPDYKLHASLTPNDLRYPNLWGLHNTGQTGGTADADIDAPEAWDKTTGSSSVVVAVIDTGVDYNHPDLKDNILKDGSGALVGYDFLHDDPDPMDDNDHGTHVSGTIGGRGNNSIGVVGVSHNVKIMPLKFLDQNGDGDTSDAINAIDYATAHGAHIMNNSWGGGGYSELLLEAIRRAKAAGILFVVAAGNETTNNDDIPTYPANYNKLCDNVISVAATDDREQLGTFSNYGLTTVDMAAPGVRIVSTTPQNTYTTMSGTSMAAPHVSGAAALIRARFPGMSYAQIKARLLLNVDYPNSIVGKVMTGRLNVNSALVTDTSEPGVPINFTATARSADAILLNWTASGDDGTSGTASRYDLRYSTSPITAANFDAATPVAGIPLPLPVGTTQAGLAAGLLPDEEYYFGLRAQDNVGSVSPVALLGPVSTSVSSPQVIVLEDSVEGTPRFSGQSPWSATTEASFSPTHSYTDSPNALYSFSRDVSLTQLNEVALSGFAPVLKFNARTSLEDFYDYVYIEVTTDDGARWQRQELALNGSAQWGSYQLSLAKYYGQSVRVRFRLITDNFVNQDGVWLDDIRISGNQLETLGSSTLPMAPRDLSAAPTSQTEINLTWTDQSQNEQGFFVERKTDTTSYQQVAELEPNVIRWTDTGRTDNTRYTYRVKAFSQVGESTPSNEASATTLPFPPGIPTGVTATPGNLQLALSWTAVAGADSYSVRRSAVPEGAFSLIRSGVLTANVIDTGLTNGTTYYYQVIAVNRGGASEPSTVVSGTPVAPPAPVPPTTLKAKRATTRRINLSWKQSLSPNVASNRVYRASRSLGPYTLVATLGATTSYTDKSVTKGAYFYVVTAVNNTGGESVYSVEASSLKKNNR